MDAVLLRDNTTTEDYYSASAVAAGDVVGIDGRAGVAVAAIAAGGTGKVYTNGIFLVKAVELIMSRGGPVGFDDNGTPYGGSTTGAATSKLASADRLMGTVIKDKVAALATVEVDLNYYPPDLIPVLFGLTFEAVSDDLTLDIQDVGKLLLVDVDAKAITLPAVAAGLKYAIMNALGDGQTIITISPNANDKIMGADLAGVDNKDRINTKATAKAGDHIVLEYGSADGWLVTRERGTWAAEA